MVINENNSHINSFTKGMNSDAAYDQILNSQYTFGQNIRITKNQSLGGVTGDFSSLHEGIVAPVPIGKYAGSCNIQGKILSVDSIDNFCVIVVTNNGSLEVYRYTIDNDIVGNKTVICSFSDFWNSNNPAPEQVSTVLYKELENVIKLYIASGSTPIITVRVDDLGIKNSNNVDEFINNRIVPASRVYINGIIQGRLRTSQVQYTYRYYNKYGNTTQLAPLTNKIQIIDPSRSKEVGNAEDTETSIGLSLKINTEDYHGFDRMLVYRLSYIKPKESAEVALIYDDKIPSTNTFVLNDIGIEPLQRLTMDEFAAMSGLILVPQIIEQNQEYMFCGNVKDDTIIKGLELNNYTFNYNTKTANIILAESSNGRVPQLPSYASIDDADIQTYLSERNVNVNSVQATYNNIFTSSLLRSLRRGEQYKYGIVYYDKYGRRSDVHTLGIVDVPEISTSPTFTVYNDRLIAHPLGVLITLPLITGANPEDIIGCQIVRRSSSNVYQKTLLLVALARPLQQGLAEQQGDYKSTKQSPFYPSGFLTTNDFIIQYHHYYDLIDGDGRNYNDELYLDLLARTKNTELYQIFSSEINYHRDDILSELNVSTTKIKEVLYLYSDFIKYVSGSEEYNQFNGLQTSVNTSAYTDLQTTDILCLINNVSGNELTQNLKAEFRKQVTTQGETIDYTTVVQNADIITIKDDTGYSNLRYFLYKNDDLLIGECLSGSSITQIIKNAFSDASTNYVSIFINNPNNDTIPNTRNIIIQCVTYNITHSIPPSFVTAIDVMKVDKLNMSNKQDIYYVFNFFKSAGVSGFVDSEIKSIKDVKMPSWNSGFENILFEDNTRIYDAVKKYRGYTTTIGLFKYNNWVSFGKYDFKPGTASYPNNSHTDSGYVAELIAPTSEYTRWLNTNTSNLDYDSLPSNGKNQVETGLRNGYIGPGPSCFLLATEQPTEGFTVPNASKFYTSICNIYRDAVQDDVISDEQEIYYGFGNYFELEYENENEKLKKKGDDSLSKYTLTVFDGDIYITPHEFTTFYKAYDFNSVDTLQSIQITNYVPLESKVNTYFDYGMNLLNTDSANLLFEPGAIDGVTSQERPAHQYNLIYSDNDTSNDVFTLISTDKNETNQFKQRAYYSELKTNGEFVDNFLIFKPAAFIDVDSKYGEITEMLTDKNLLYYWQDHAFGRFSVNERSLVNDQNNNTIMLGQAGILSRYDYASTKYGMRPQDFCARSTEQGIYWVDINNKAIVAGNSEQVVNYGEQLGVLNLINSRLTSDIPKVDYDLQNNELLCKCFGDDQLVFNIKYGMATSIYTRRYDWITYIKNHIFGIEGRQLIKFNYLNEIENTKYLLPVELEFIVNHSASITKVFDNQQIIPIKRNQYLGDSFDKLLMAFETDLYSTNAKPELYTDREGNILYAIPRFDNQDYGSRLRGKWMKVKFTNDDESLSDNFTISHVITKFRQSFS